MSDDAKRRKRINNSSKNEVIYKRSRTIRLIGSYIPQLTRPAFRKHSPLLTRLMLDWEQFAGSNLARASAPKRLNQGVLTVSCQGPIAIELHYNMTQIIERINTSCGLIGEHKLIRLKIIQDKVVTMSVQVPVRSSPQLVIVENFEDGPLKTALARLGGQIRSRGRR